MKNSTAIAIAVLTFLLGFLIGLGTMYIEVLQIAAKHWQSLAP